MAVPERTVALGTSLCKGARGGSSSIGALPHALRRALSVLEGHARCDGSTFCVCGCTGGGA